MDINQISYLIHSEWEDFYIDYKLILKILNPKNRKNNNDDSNIDNT